MKRLLMIALVLSAAGLLNCTMPVAHADVVANLTVPVTGGASAGCGEAVILDGNMHLLVSVTTDENGGVHLHIHVNTLGVSATGLSSGTVYRSVTVQNTIVNLAGPPPAEASDVFLLRLLGPGRGGNLIATGTSHVTVNANGDVTANFSNFNVSCQ